jgi:hypothetical protein
MTTWTYSIPRNRAERVQLLTIGRVAVHGTWTGTYGEHFIAWAPLPARDMAVESKIIRTI